VFTVFLYFFRAPFANFPLGLERNNPAAIPRNFVFVRTMISAPISAGGQTVRGDRRRSHKHCYSENSEEKNRFYE
jgi:hypothetical protein